MNKLASLIAAVALCNLSSASLIKKSLSELRNTNTLAQVEASGICDTVSVPVTDLCECDWETLDAQHAISDGSDALGYDLGQFNI